jgi:hypothetical protein
MVLRKLDAIHHKCERLALGIGMRKLNSTKSAIQILTNTDHPVRSYFTNPNKLDEYAMRPRNPQPLFIRTVGYRGET